MSELQDDAPATTSKREDKISNAQSAMGGKGDSLVGHSVTINRPAAELYTWWRDFSRLSSFMDNVESVEVINNTTSHWVVKAPGGKTVEWDAVITEDRANGSGQSNCNAFPISSTRSMRAQR